MAQERYFLTWVESDKAEIVEEMLDERKVPIDMLNKKNRTKSFPYTNI